MRNTVQASLILSLLFGLAGAAQAASAEVPPVAALSAYTAVSNVRISPDGKHLAATVHQDGRQMLTVYSLPDLKPGFSFGVKGDTEVEDFYWAKPDRLMFGFARRLGPLGSIELSGYLFAINADGSRRTMLIGDERRFGARISAEQRDFEVVDTLPADRDHVLIEQFTDSELPRLFRINVYTGARQELMQSTERYGHFITDLQGRPRLLRGSTTDGAEVLDYRGADGGAWKQVARAGTDTGGLRPLVFAADSQHVYAADRRKTSTETLGLFDFDKGEVRVLDEDPAADVEALIPGLSPGKYIGVIRDDGKPRWRFFDPSDPDVTVLDGLRKSFPGQTVRILNFNEARTLAVVAAESDVKPLAFYVVDLAARQLLARLPSRPELETYRFDEQQVIRVKARDGTVLHGYLTLPRQAEGNVRVPMIVLPHGGPHRVRDYWGFDPEVQLFASRGYAVLQVNFRGSDGFGRSFELAGHRQWGRAMEDDLVDAARWAIEQHVADPARIGIFGASYGGYAALMAMVRAPEVFRAAAGYAGVYDLGLMYTEGDIPKRAEGLAYLREVIGEDAADLRDRSPVAHAAEIRGPVFLAHGGADQRVPIVQFKHMSAALAAAGMPVETLVKDDEAHGFYDASNRAELYTRLLDFFARSLAAPAADGKPKGAP